MTHQDNIYTISTSEIEGWVQQQIDASAKALNQPSVPISLRTLSASTRFYPFQIVFSRKSMLSYTNEIPTCAWAFVRNYMYTKNARKYFESARAAKELGIVSAGKCISDLAVPTIAYVDGEASTRVLLDPLRIFHSWAAQESGKALDAYRIKILKVECVKDDYVYTFKQAHAKHRYREAFGGKWKIASDNPLLDGECTDGHTKYLQDIDLPIMVNSVIDGEELKLSEVSEMHIGEVDGKPTLIITPLIVG